MKQIIIRCNYINEIFCGLRNAIDHLKDTNIDFKVYLENYEITLPTLNIKLNYIPADALKNYNEPINTKIIDANNFSIKEIIESDE